MKSIIHNSYLSIDLKNRYITYLTSFLRYDPNVDILSPQLHSSGSEAAPQFAVTARCATDCAWNVYSGFKGLFAPSIVETFHFAAASRKCFWGAETRPWPTQTVTFNGSRLFEILLVLFILFSFGKNSL